MFSPEHARSKGFVENLEMASLKKAFREKAKRYHPDLNGMDSDEMIARRQERFVKIKVAYEHLFKKLQKKNPHIIPEPVEAQVKKPKIIAIGGAKGGIGKSILTSNLSVYLSQKGFDTVAVDLDLGGSNLHLFLGKPTIRKSINDYLSNTVSNLNDIIETSKYGPRLIGGNSSQLGAANISFTQKLKLLRALRKITADYVIIDLGGDTSYNVIDFFLAADLGLVMTTCEPASYLDAYSFIKVALYRKLNRLYGPESMEAGQTDPFLKRLIIETTLSKSDPMVGDIEVLLSRVAKEQPRSLNIIQRALSGFNPQLIVNKVLSESEAFEPVKRIQMVSRKKLSIQVDYLCSMPFQASVEKSARTLVPWIYNGSDTRMVRQIDTIVTKLMKTAARKYNH